MRICEIPKRDRPREKLARQGPAALTDVELLAIFLRTGMRGKNAIALAAELVAAKGTLTALSRCSAAEIVKAALGIGPAKAAELSAAFELGRRLARGEEDRPVLDSANAIFSVFGPELQSLNRESVKAVLLDTKLRLLRVEDVSLGSLSECIAHPREIFRPAIIYSAYAVVVVHNHPSGDPAPSNADQRLTCQLTAAASLLQIQLMDHIIIGSADGGRMPHFSFRDAGTL